MTTPGPGPREPEVLVVIQLESFLDPERLGGPPLPLMDLVRSRAAQYGRLRVPAHGAYTMRSEHAVLTGRTAAELGFGVFDPYLAAGGDEPIPFDERGGELRAADLLQAELHDAESGECPGFHHGFSFQTSASARSELTGSVVSSRPCRKNRSSFGMFPSASSRRFTVPCL